MCGKAVAQGMYGDPLQALYVSILSNRGSLSNQPWVVERLVLQAFQKPI
jgi:hypothetical protein